MRAGDEGVQPDLFCRASYLSRQLPSCMGTTPMALDADGKSCTIVLIAHRSSLIAQPGQKAMLLLARDSQSLHVAGEEAKEGR